MCLEFQNNHRSTLIQMSSISLSQQCLVQTAVCICQTSKEITSRPQTPFKDNYCFSFGLKLQYVKRRGRRTSNHCLHLPRGVGGPLPHQSVTTALGLQPKVHRECMREGGNERWRKVTVCVCVRVHTRVHETQDKPHPYEMRKT